MAAARVRNADAMASRSGGQESEALMVFLASVKEECKPPVYSAFISLMNAYHGNMLAVDALLDELFALFSPRVRLLAGIKPLVDKSHHARIDELCGQVRGDPGFVSSVLPDPSSNDNGFDGCHNEITAGLGGLLGTGSILHDSVENTSSSASGGRHHQQQQQQQPRTPTLNGIGSPGSRSQSSSPHNNRGAATTIVKLSGSPMLTPIGSKAGRDGSHAASGAGGLGGGRTTPTFMDDQTMGLALRSPSSQVLTTEQEEVAVSAQALMSDVDVGVDHALLDFMMCDTSPAMGSSEPPPEPPPIEPSSQQQPQQMSQHQTPQPRGQQQQQQQQRHQHKQQQQQQQTPQQKHQQQQRQQYLQPESRVSPQWSSSASSPPPNTHAHPGSAGINNNTKGNGADASTDVAGSVSSNVRGGTGVGSNGFSQHPSTYPVASAWHRSESAPNLQVGLAHGGPRAQQQQQQQQPQQSCRIHNLQTPGCRDCQGLVQNSIPTLVRRSSGSCTVTNASMAMGSPVAGNPTRRHSSVPVSQNSNNYGGGGCGNSRGGNVDVDGAGYLGPGKRVWEERGASTPSSSSAGAGAGVSPANSYFFPSATAAAAAAAVASSAVNTSSNLPSSSRPHLKRRIASDSAVAGIDEERTSPTLRGSDGGVRSPPPTSAPAGASGGPYADGPSLDSSALSSEFVGFGTATLNDEGFSHGGRGAGGGGGSGGGGDGGQRGSSLHATGGNDSEMEKLVLNVATKAMQQALQYGLRHTFTQILQKKDREIAELKEEALRWSANDTRLRQMNQQLVTETMQLRHIIEQSLPPNPS